MISISVPANGLTPESAGESIGSDDKVGVPYVNGLSQCLLPIRPIIKYELALIVCIAVDNVHQDM